MTNTFQNVGALKKVKKKSLQLALQQASVWKPLEIPEQGRDVIQECLERLKEKTY